MRLNRLTLTVLAGYSLLPVAVCPGQNAQLGRANAAHAVPLLRQAHRPLASPLMQHHPVDIAQQQLAIASLPESVTTVACPEATASICGYLPVPLDRRRPEAGKTHIYFEVYPHTGTGQALSAILVNFGGPGGSTTASRDFIQYLFAPNLDVHDLLLIDDRGRGQSGAIDCSELQHGTAPFIQSEADCAAQLGSSAGRYGSGDIAEDLDAVRAALGYQKVDFFGASYGGIDVTAYATRFGQHLRSIVLDAPVGAPAINEFARLAFRTHSDPHMVRSACLRSPLCSQDQPEPEETFSELVRSIQAQPIEGDTYDASGNPMHIRVDEKALLNFVVTYPTGAFTSTGEILAAGKALEAGDKAPLLRLAAEGYFALGQGDYGDPTNYSQGSFYATGCVDAQQPWKWTDPLPERIQKYTAAVQSLPWDYFSPFSTSAPTGILFSTLGKQCLWWQEPTLSSPVVSRDPSFTHVPTLVLSGDLDNRVPLEETAEVAALFPNATYVKIPEAGHFTIDYSPCAQTLASRFLENLQPGDTSCANSPYQIFPAVGRFPLRSQDAHPAKIDPALTNQADEKERKNVSVAVATAIDALQRVYIGSGNGVGLRGGTFSAVFGATNWTVTLTNCAFASDVVVNGTLTWNVYTDSSLVSDLIISGPGTAGGSLHVTGFWQAPGPAGDFSITGTLGGKQVAVLVPEA